MIKIPLFIFSFLVYNLRPRSFCYNSHNSSLLPDTSLMLVLEYAPYGDLLGYLRKSRGLEDKYYSSHECCRHEVTSYDLVSFSQQIASGMSFLASKKVRITEIDQIIDYQPPTPFIIINIVVVVVVIIIIVINIVINNTTTTTTFLAANPSSYRILEKKNNKRKVRTRQIKSILLRYQLVDRYRY